MRAPYDARAAKFAKDIFGAIKALSETFLAKQGGICVWYSRVGTDVGPFRVRNV